MISAASVRDRDSEADVIAFLRGTPRVPADPSSFAYVAARHGVAPLLVKTGVSAWIPAGDAEPLVAEARRQAVLGELRDRHLRDALAALHRAGIAAIVMKGSHLAHTCYPEPYLRPRDDSDILIRAADRDRVAAALAGAGYRLERGASNRQVLGQMVFDKPGCAAAVLDVHWRIFVPLAAAELFDVEALLGRSLPVPALGPSARAVAPADALALACVHQAAHHAGHEMLLWMYDIHLLIATMGRAAIDAFVQDASARRMVRICLAAIETSAAAFPSTEASALIARLRDSAAAEPGAPLLEPRRKIDDLRADLAALPGWRARVRLLAGHLFPPAEFMRTTYAPGSRTPLPLLYVRRIVRGVGKWVR
jgi:hypothetical protein